MKQYKGFIIGLIIGAVLMIPTGIFAESSLQKVEAYLNTGLKLDLNGHSVTFKNTPLTYNGYTYLPVRDLSDLIGLDVGWDDKTSTVTLNNTKKVEDVISVPIPVTTPTVDQLKLNNERTLKFKNNFDFSKKVLVSNEVESFLTYKGSLSQSDFEDYWEDLPNRDGILIEIAKEQQSVNPQYNLTIWLSYKKSVLVTIEYSKEGHSYLSYSSNPFPKTINQ